MEEVEKEEALEILGFQPYRWQVTCRVDGGLSTASVVTLLPQVNNMGCSEEALENSSSWDLYWERECQEGK